MPEGDTLHRTALTLQRAIGGQVVLGFSTAYATLAAVDDQAPVSGRTIEQVTAVGKHLLMHLSASDPPAAHGAGHARALVLRTHMRMSGAWHLYRPGEPWRVRASAVRIRIDTAPWTALAVNVPVAEFVAASALGRHAPLARLGPDVLGETFDTTAGATRLTSAGSTPIAEALLDQRLVSGIGNVLRSEVLFLAGIDPHVAAGDLDSARLDALLVTARKVMRLSTRLGERRTTSRANREEDLWVYGRAGRPCRRCGTPIAVSRRGADARPLFWCPTCQPA
ncbi:MAG: Fpg/Nei family DNA glycosylase [Vicinamibacterales bacterium]